MSVFFVIGGAELKVGGLCATLAGGAGCGTLLLAEYRLQFQLAELEVCAQTEQTAHTRNQTHVAGEGYISCLDELDDFVLLAIVLQLHVLRVEVEGGFCVVIQIQVYLVAHLTIE